MAAISRRRQGGRIYNNTRVRELLRRKCVKPADLTTHSPPKTSARPRTATRPPRALPLPHAAPTHARRLCDAFLVDRTTHSPPKAFPAHVQRHALPSTSAPPRSADARPPTARCIPRRPHNPFPAEGLLPPTHSDTPSLSSSVPPRSADARPQAARCTPADCAMHSSPPSQPIPRRRPSPSSAQRHALAEALRSPTQSRRTPAGCAMYSPPTSPPIPRRRPPLAPAQRHALPEHFRSPMQRRRTPAGCAMHSSSTAQPIPRRRPSPPTYSDTPSRALPLPHAAPTHTRRLRDAFLAHLTTHSRRRPSPAHAQRHAPPPFRFGHKKNGTAQRVCDAECLGRPSLRSVIWVGEPRAVRRRCGALAWCVELRLQPWALRSRRCGRVLRA